MKKNIFLFFVLFIPLFLVGCRETAPERTCDIKSLLLTKAHLNLEQRTITFEGSESPVPGDPGESAAFTLNVASGSSSDLVDQEVIRYQYIGEAVKMYEIYLKFFGTDHNSGNWKMPKEVTSIEIHADQSHTACGFYNSEKRCAFNARYKEYLVFFQMGISEKGLTPADFAKGVEKIDELTVACIGQ